MNKSPRGVGDPPGKLISESIYPLGRDFYNLTMLQGEEFDMDALLEIGEILEKSY